MIAIVLQYRPQVPSSYDQLVKYFENASADSVGKSEEELSSMRGFTRVRSCFTRKCYTLAYSTGTL